MRGTLEQRMPSVAASAEMLSGSVNGSMVVNRRRGWLSESRLLVQMRTTIAARGATAGTSGAAGAAKATGAAAPMQVRMKITQHMRVFDKR
jgi:IS5 family transposase